MSNLLYDNGFIVTLSNNNNNFAGYKGAFAGNGKLALYNSMNKIGTDQIVISVGDVTFDQIGKYKNNVIEGFGMNEIRIFDHSNSNIVYAMQSQTLDFSTGRCSSVFNVNSNNDVNVNVTSTVTPLRQFPYCVLQTVTIKPSSNMASLDIVHMFQANTSFTNMEYNNNTFFNDKIYSDKGLYIMNAKAYHPELQCQVCCASSYFNNSNILGFNVIAKKEACYQQFRLNNLVAESNYNINILTTMMTDKDFPHPLEEVKRILMNIAFKITDVNALINQLNIDNDAAWQNLWISDIQLNPKLNITQPERDRVMRIRRYIRQSLYTVFCCVREGVNSEVNPLSLSYIDTNGNLYYDSDIWLIPALLILKPSIARTMLEFRYKGLEQAIQLAASFGYKGSKYPYENDIVGYKSLYWDVASPLHIFNNAIIAINVWNYFRVTVDKEWLSNKGYIIMKNISDFLVSNINDAFDMPNVVGLGGRVSTNHAFTLYATKMALKYTIEASYELNFAPKQAWLDKYINIDMEYFTGLNNDVIKYDSTYDNTQTLQIIDNLMIMLPYYSAIYLSGDPNHLRDYNSIARNLTYYENTASDEYTQHPLNNMLKASMYGVISQSDTTYLSGFYDKLDHVIDQNALKTFWGHISEDVSHGVDVTLNGLFLFIFLNIVGGMRIRGGITEGKFYYEPYSLYGPSFVNMPDTWKNIVYSAVGNDQELYNVVNNVFGNCDCP